MSDRPRVVSILTRPPHPARDGGGIRNYHLLAALASRFDVTALAAAPPGTEELPWAFPDGVNGRCIPIAGGLVATGRAAARSFGGDAFSVARYRSPTLEHAVREAVEQIDPVWTVAHSYHVGELAASTGTNSWVDLHNIDSEIWSAMAATGRSLAIRRFAQWQCPRVRRVEEHVLRTTTGASFVSAEDLAVGRTFAPAIDAVVVPNGVDLDRYPMRPGPPAAPRLVFIGDLRWAPNVDGIDWFARQVWPALQSLVPALGVDVIGRFPPDRVRHHADDRFRVIGDVADTRPYLDQATIAIVPLLAGGGTRLKILEAAARGVPVVSTTIGAAGLQFSSPDEIVRVDTADAWVESILDLTKRPDDLRDLAERARMRVEQTYDWASIRVAFADTLMSRSFRVADG